VAFVPSGMQLEIAFGEQRATVVEVGGAVREYEVGGLAVLDPFPVEAICDGAHGTPLVPWPNRLGDGRYSWDGESYQVALTEPEKRNAIHGLLRWAPWAVRAHDADRVVMGATIHPQSGYPFALDATVEYRLDSDGLRVTTTATNLGDRALPYAHGQHPYLSAGGGLLDDCTLEFTAATRIVTDAERQLPTGTDPVQGTEFDFSTRRAIGAFSMDFAFTDVMRDATGRGWVSLGRPDGTRAEIWVDDTYPYVELYTGDTLAPHRQRRGLGSEPMTCPPNAFATGQQLIRLEPGDSTVTAWGARLAT
ncbi:MAG TPA: aldose 1-epimerase family protein, partial [Acidimicrobiia bacterium]|nr:aldose 1-epimerase family protein [Acidimicrobiia bacterium]